MTSSGDTRAGRVAYLFAERLDLSDASPSSRTTPNGAEDRRSSETIIKKPENQLAIRRIA